MNVTAPTAFTATASLPPASTGVIGVAGEQDPAVRNATVPPVKQAPESAKQGLQQEQEHAKHASATKQQQEQELKLVSELAARDREVRAHEQAHAAVGGAFAGAPTYTFERGPDGVSYAVGGEVSISTSGVPGNPEATIRKADLVRRAALAPVQPSAQDHAVAAQAAQMKIQAQIELATQTEDAKAANNHKPGEAQQNAADDAAAAGAPDDSDQPDRADFLQRNLMTEQTLEKGNESGRMINMLL